jgi:hypothetical protein
MKNRLLNALLSNLTENDNNDREPVRELAPSYGVSASTISRPTHAA